MRDRMIILDDTRIRLSNIKNYGISSGKKFTQKLYTRKEVLNPVGVVASIFSLLREVIALMKQLSTSMNGLENGMRV